MKCPKCQAEMGTEDGSLVCPSCGYREPAFTITISDGEGGGMSQNDIKDLLDSLQAAGVEIINIDLQQSKPSEPSE